jgi:hypothetical protein
MTGVGRVSRVADAVLAGLAMVILMGGAAAAQGAAERAGEAASGFAVAPPAGYLAKPDAPMSALEVAVSVARADEPDTRCRISFEAIPGFSQYSQAELNREADRPNFDAFYRDSVGAFYAVSAVVHFDHAGIRGAAIDAVSRARPATPGWRDGLPTRIFMLYTPKGLTKATCSAVPAAFEARRGEFEAVARAVTVPR